MVYARAGTLSRPKCNAHDPAMGFMCGAAVPAGLLYALWAWALGAASGGLTNGTRATAAAMAAITCSAVFGFGNADEMGFPGPLGVWAEASTVYTCWASAWAVVGALRARPRAAP
jgi:hypothetical protein